MDRYEFRGLRADGKGWVYGDYFDTSKSEYCNFLPTIIEKGGCNREDFNLVIPETVGQYTGVTGKNGVKVFVGDKFNPISKNLTYVVVFKEAQFGLESELGYWGSLKRYYELAERHNWSYEVIGNIHESEVVL